MFTTSIINGSLEGHIISDNMPEITGEFINFRILEAEKTELNSSYLHIGRASDLYEASKRKWNKDLVYTVIITDGDTVMDTYNTLQSFRIITTDLSLLSVVNSIAELADEYNRMQSLRRHLTGATDEAEPLIEGAAKTMNADCFYLTGRFRVLNCCKTVNCPDFDYLIPGEYLKADDLLFLKDEWMHFGDWMARFSPIKIGNEIDSYLLIVMKNNSKNIFNSDMFHFLCLCMSEYIEQNQTDRAVASGRFTRLVHDIIDGHITSQEAITERLQNIGSSPKGLFYLIVIETEKLIETLPSDIFPSISAMFPNSFPVQYNNKLLILAPANDIGELINFDEQDLLEILSEYKLFACIGNPTVSLRSLKADYLKVSKCLGFARTFCEDKNKRLFRAENYAIYDVIDICCNALTEQYHGDTIRLCNRGAVALFNYDKNHGTNYSKILKQYLLNNKNTTQTAEDFNLHRNTLMYKLETISRMTGEDLNDPQICFRLLFSLFAIDYLDIYQNRNRIEPEAYSEILKRKKRSGRKD